MLLLYKRVNDRTKKLVNGYVHLNQSLLPFNIPRVINQICCIFYFQYDEWDEDVSNPQYLIENNVIMTTSYNCSHSSFLSNIVSKGKHHWRFKLLDYNKKYIRIYYNWTLE